MLTITCHTALTSPRQPSCRPDRPATMATFEGIVQAVARALLLDVTLAWRSFTVGRYHEATADAGPRWACLDGSGAVVSQLEFEEHAVSAWERETVERQDWSAFGAAYAFVGVVGVPEARSALARKGLYVEPFSVRRARRPGSVAEWRTHIEACRAVRAFYRVTPLHSR